MHELDQYFFYDKPIPYKELNIYPAIMRDYIDFHLYANCLLLDKNSTPNPQVITMSYLSYIYFLAGQDTPYLYMLKMLLCMVLHIEEKSIKFYSVDGRSFFSIHDKEYSSEDFDNIKSIICEQNCLEVIDETIQKEIRDAMDKAEEYKMEQNANKVCSLEEQMICVLISTPLRLEDIYSLTIRKFSKILQRVDYKMHYEIYLSAEMSGMVTFKNPNAIKHWMSDLSKNDKYEDVKVGMEDMRSKLDINKK